MLLDRPVNVSSETGIFITMNPGYAGRRNLPDNLKQLFRSIAMVRPDRELIAQVMLFSQGFRTAEALARKVVPLFELCNDQLSRQSHYDFGLRALKSVLVSAGVMKRSMLGSPAASVDGKSDNGYKRCSFACLFFFFNILTPSLSVDAIPESERELLLRAVVDTVVPKLVADDIPLLRSLLTDVFPGAALPHFTDERLEEKIREVPTFIACPLFASDRFR